MKNYQKVILIVAICIGRGYFLFKNGDISNNLMVGEKYNYDSFEYYEDKLQGNYRVLKGISSLLKDKIALITF